MISVSKSEGIRVVVCSIDGRECTEVIHDRYACISCLGNRVHELEKKVKLLEEVITKYIKES